MLFKKFRCAYCDKLTIYRGHKLTDQNGEVVNRLCELCSIEDDAAWEQYRQGKDAEDQAERDETYEDDIFDSEHVTDYAEADDPYEDDEDDYVSTSVVYARAYAHFGNAEMAREAAEMYPGDFI